MQASQARSDLISKFLYGAVFLSAANLAIVISFLPIMIIMVVDPYASSFHFHLNQAFSIISSYLLPYTISLLVAGRFSEIYGRRRSYFVCLSLSIIGSVWIIATPIFGQLLWGLALQALGAGGCIAIAAKLINEINPSEGQNQALKRIALSVIVGFAAGHLFGVLLGIFESYWRLIFWINLIFGLVALFSIWRLLGDREETQIEAKFDWLGAGFITSSLIFLHLGLAVAVEIGQADRTESLNALLPSIWNWLSLALLLFIGFIGWEHFYRYPLINPMLLRNRNIRISSLICLLICVALAIIWVAYPFVWFITNIEYYFQYYPRLGPSIFTTSLILSCFPLFAFAGIHTNWWEASERKYICGGLIITSIGLFIMSVELAIVNEVVLGLILSGFGLGLLLFPITRGTIEGIDPQEQSTILTWITSMGLIGITIGSALYLYSTKQAVIEVRQGPNPELLAYENSTSLYLYTGDISTEAFSFPVQACLVALLISFFFKSADSWKKR